MGFNPKEKLINYIKIDNQLGGTLKKQFPKTTLRLGALGLCLGFMLPSAFAQELRVMTYNVENLFDTQDSNDTNDSEFTPEGKQRWTETVLADKIKNLGTVISDAGAEIIGVQEVENQEVLEQLVKQGLAGKGFVAAYAGPSDDDRGIRNGIISKHPIVSVKSHRVWDDTWTENGAVKKTRDILEAKIRVTKGKAQQDITFLVNHWPSRGGAPAFRNRIRLDTARKMKVIVQNIVQQDPGALVLSMGDFNDELEDRSFEQGVSPLFDLAQFLRSKAGTMFALDSDMSDLPDEESGTYYYGRENQWNHLDHMLMAVGDDLLKGTKASFNYKSGSIHRGKTRFMSQGKYPRGCQLSKQDQNRTRCPNGASDHFPLVADFFARSR